MKNLIGLFTALTVCGALCAQPIFYHPSPDCPFIPPKNDASPSVSYVEIVELALKALKCPAADSFRKSLQELRNAENKRALGQDVATEPTLAKLKDSFEWYLKASEDCYPGQVREVVEREVLTVAVNTISLLAAAEPISGVASVGIGLAGAALNSLIQHSYDRNTPEFFHKLLEQTQSAKRLACLFLEGTEKKLGCHVTNKEPTPRFLLPGAVNEEGTRFGRAHDYLFGTGNAEDGSIRKLSTIYGQIQAQRIPHLLNPDGSDPGEGIMDHYLSHLFGTLTQKVPDLTMVPVAKQVPGAPVRLDQMKIESDKVLIDHLKEIHAHLTRKLAPPANGFRPLPVDPVKKMKDNEQVEALGKFLAAYDKVDPHRPTRDQLKALVSTIHSSPVHINHVVNMYWEEANRPGLPNPVFDLMCTEYETMKRNDMARHQELLAAYGIHKPPPRNADTKQLDAARAEFAKAYDFFLMQTKPILSYELSEAARRLKAASDNTKTIGNPKDFFNSYLLPVLQYCALTPGAFYRLPEEGIEARKLIPIPFREDSRKLFETHCRRFQCEGGLPELPTKAMDTKDGAALDKFECATVQNYAKIATNLMKKFEQDPNVNNFCHQAPEKPKKGTTPASNHKGYRR